MEKKKNTLVIKSLVVKWARESIGFSFEEASTKSKISIDKIKEWESNDTEIKVSDIKKIAKAYKRTLSFFFLSKPPEVNPVPNDFRTLDSVNVETLSPEVRLAIRKAQRNRKFYSYLLEVTNTSHVIFPKINYQHNPSAIAIRFRSHLKIGLNEQKEWPSEGFALNRWIDAIESYGVPVFQISLPKKEIRGFCLRENSLPSVIVLNGSDAIRGRIFTLFHEFYHLLLQQSDIDTLVKTKGEHMAHKLIEMKANEFAGSFLVPDADFLTDPSTIKYIETKEDRFVVNLEKTYKVSPEVIYRRLVILGYLSEKDYLIKREELKQKYTQEELKNKKIQEQREKPFIPDYYLNVAKGSSYSLSQKAFSAVFEGKISTNELVTFLNVKLSGLNKVLDKTNEHYTKGKMIVSKAI